ncbi:nitronate monooxygenase [Aspergillus mulundensis]|uniref:Uncharacterized protein n=1 Tax=Aspergillus mulundensis TaxID=1810919 RepID=A0A3D8T4L3_9EURO|nr:hypothetical protein DSM5745_00791 [Aspergillus mulundensis]RDW93469.1 hypothetical protein DSM5745_00791 [Aspergillus mulundensis]
MSSLATKLTARFQWASSPLIVSAPMRVMAGPALAVAVSRAGGLGFIGPTIKTNEMLAVLKEASALTRKSTNLALPASKNLPVGVGFQLWSDDLETATQAVEKYKPCVVWLYAPKDVKDLDTWSRRFRDVSSETQIWVQVGTLAEVRALLKAAQPPDAIVIQGSEAGGHGRASDGLGLFSLLPEAVDLVAGRIPLLAAGGIADARGASAALCLGASGVVLGTRFLASTEAKINPGYQREIIRADDGAVSTTRTLLYNHLRGVTGWPKEYSPRGVINRSFIEHQAGTSFDELKKRHDELVRLGEKAWGPDGRTATYAGASVGLVRNVKDAGDIVREIQEGVRRMLRHEEGAKL